MPDLPPGALEEMERLLEWTAQWELAEALVDHAEPLLALAREALTLRPKVQAYQERLEITHIRAKDPTTGEMVRIPVNPDDYFGTKDGIACRDETIAIQDRNLDYLRERVAGLTASLDACAEGHTHQTRRAEAAEARADKAEEVVAEAYQMMGAVANAYGFWSDDDHEGKEPFLRALDRLAYYDTTAQESVLPWMPPEHPAVAEAARLRAAARAVIDMRFSTYRARNGREISIEGDDGEKVWLVPSDAITHLEAALRPAAPAPSCQGSLDDCGSGKTEEKTHE